MSGTRFSGEVDITGDVTIRGPVDFGDNDIVRFGDGDDCELYCDGTNMVMDINSGIGKFVIRDGSTTRFTFNDNGVFEAGNIETNTLQARTGTKIIRSIGIPSQNIEFDLNSSENVILSNGDKNVTMRVYPGRDIVFSTKFSTTSSGYLDRLKVTNKGEIVISTLNGSGTSPAELSSAGTLRRGSSDARLKTNVTELANQTDIVKQLRPVSYNWIDTENRGDRTEIGFIAQEVEPLVPEVVGMNYNGEDEEESMYVNYPQLVATLTKALQESISRIEELETRLDQLDG